MTEYNLFCYSKSYNNKNSFQQKRWRIFNTEVGEIKYRELLGKCKDILGKKNLKLSDFWKQVTQNQWKQLMSLAQDVRGDNFKEGFEYISGQKIEDEAMIEIEDEAMIEINGKEYSASTIQEALKRYVNE